MLRMRAGTRLNTSPVRADYLLQRRSVHAEQVQSDDVRLLRGLRRAGHRKQLRAAAVSHLSQQLRHSAVEDHPAGDGQLPLAAVRGRAVGGRGGPCGLPADGGAGPRVLRGGPDSAHGAARGAGRPLRGSADRAGGVRPGRRPAGGAHQPHRGGLSHRQQGEGHEPAALLLLLGPHGRGAALHAVLCDLRHSALEDHGDPLGTDPHPQRPRLPARAHRTADRGR